jgi:hypothetical protein
LKISIQNDINKQQIRTRCQLAQGSDLLGVGSVDKIDTNLKSEIDRKKKVLARDENLGAGGIHTAAKRHI